MHTITLFYELFLYIESNKIKQWNHALAPANSAVGYSAAGYPAAEYSAVANSAVAYFAAAVVVVVAPPHSVVVVVDLVVAGPAAVVAERPMLLWVFRSYFIRLDQTATEIQ